MLSKVSVATDHGRAVTGTGKNRRIRRALGWASIATGTAVGMVGLAFGQSAITTWNDSFDRGKCDADTLVCSPEGQNQTDTARFRANVSNVMVASGLLLAVAGTWLVLTVPDAGESVRLVPLVGPDESVGLTALGMLLRVPPHGRQVPRAASC